MEALRVANDKVLAEAVAKDPVTKKVHNSYIAYWRNSASGRPTAKSVYHSKILKG